MSSSMTLRYAHVRKETLCIVVCIRTYLTTSIFVRSFVSVFRVIQKKWLADILHTYLKKVDLMYMYFGE